MQRSRKKRCTDLRTLGVDDDHWSMTETAIPYSIEFFREQR
jgi:hypothetical protein